MEGKKQKLKNSKEYLRLFKDFLKKGVNPKEEQETMKKVELNQNSERYIN